uniref:Uncharacterized protein n=1 Tax=Rhodnius prolixus TaxID=13249 RepID=T1ICS5_RHOPR
MADNKPVSDGSSGARAELGGGSDAINSLIIAKLDSLSAEITAFRKEQSSLCTDMQTFKREFKKLSSNLEKDLKVCKKNISKLFNENNYLKKHINNLNKEMLFCSHTPYSNTIKIDNISVSENENLYSIIEGLSKQIDVVLREETVDYIYRRKFGRGSYPPSIIVKFLYSSIKRKFVRNSKLNKDKLKSSDNNQQINVNDLLSPFAYKLFVQ